ncbi:uncharacterized protein VTP21DRAFT_10910 [Calcarisporiella thermophila]|uniref:uncharacterized protein n=1 Tax=Calcarisporiella thermophila TaxID=911321 RepID=UPI0037427365
MARARALVISSPKVHAARWPEGPGRHDAIGKPQALPATAPLSLMHTPATPAAGRPLPDPAKARFHVLPVGLRAHRAAGL